MINNNSSSRLKLSPIDKKFLLNILLTLNPEVLINSTGEPIITMSDDKNVIIIGTNYLKTTSSFEFLPPLFSTSFILYILERMEDWAITRSITAPSYKESKLNSISRSSDGGMIILGSELSTTSFKKEIKYSTILYDYKQCMKDNGVNDQNKYNNINILSSDKEDMFGYSVAVSRDGSRFYSSHPMHKINNEYGYQGRVVEFVKRDNRFISNRVIILPNSILEKNKNIYLGLELELLNKDNTLAMTSFGGIVYTYLLNKQEDLNYDYSNGPKICYIDELFNVV